MAVAIGPSPGLLDRARERDVIAQLVAGIRAGQSQALVLRGQAGAGKTALLRHVPDAAEGCTIVWATGVESEAELAFAGLHSLCAPMLDRLEHLPAPQRDALNRIEHEDAPWLTERDKLRFREVIDKLLRFIDYLDAIRDRTSILHDDLSTVISERIASNSNRLAALAALLLPPSVVAGLFGMNVGGIPGVNDTWAFVAIVGFVVIVTLILGLAPIIF